MCVTFENRYKKLKYKICFALFRQQVIWVKVSKNGPNILHQSFLNTLTHLLEQVDQVVLFVAFVK